MYVCVDMFFVFVDCNVFNFGLALPNKLQARGYSARNVRANANFSGIVAKEFRLSARESVNFVQRLLSQDFASETLHDRRRI